LFGSGSVSGSGSGSGLTDYIWFRFRMCGGGANGL